MSTLNLLYKKYYDVNDSIRINIPTVGEVIDNEDAYYSVVTAITAMPVDLMVQLDDLGIDYAEINEFELFIIMSTVLKTQDTSLIFGDLDFNKFEACVNQETGKIALYDAEDGIVIDRATHSRIAGILRKIHHLEKNRRKPANKEARDYMLKRAREKMKRNQNKERESQLEPLIIAMVNAEQYKYDFEGTRELSIYQFNESVRQIIKKVDYDNRMHGIYAGTINPKEMSQDDLNWLSHK